MLPLDGIRYSIRIMRQTFPEAGTTLTADTNYHFLLATVLSAQLTDQSVNEVTPALFVRFPLSADLAGVEPAEVKPYIKRLGFYRNKVKFLIKTSQQTVTDFNGEVPHALKELMTLSGVGRRVADVVLTECFNIPAFPVDTHVSRAARRLRIVEPEASVLATEEKLMKIIPPEHWLDAHRSIIFWGRYVCTARDPKY